jgi:alpha-1,3-galactosidase B
MRKYLPIALMALSLTLSSCGLFSSNSKATTYTTEQPPQGDATLWLKQQLANLPCDGKPYILRLPKGTYHFHPENASIKELYISNHDQTNPKHITFLIEGKHNLTIDAQGSDFIFHGTMLPFALLHCENLTLKNCSIDFELPHLRQLTITEVDKAANKSIATLHPEGHYKIKNGKLYLTGEDYELQPEVAMAFQPNKLLTYQRGDVDFAVKKVTELHPNTFQLEGWSQNALTSVGERFALRTYHRPTPAIFVDSCKNMHFQDVTVHYAWGMGLLAQMTETITLKGLK